MRSYCCSTCRVADPFSSLGTFSSSSSGGPVFHPIADCEHPLLCLPGTSIASHSYIRVLPAKSCWPMQWCQRLEADYGMDPQVWQSLDGPSFHLSSKLCLRNSFYIVLPEDPAIPLLGIYPEDVPIRKKDTCSTMFIAALFIIARS